MRMKRTSVIALIALATATAGLGQLPLTNDDVVAMVEAGLSARLVTQIVSSQPSGFDLGASAIVDLGERGVPEQVIEAMVTTTKSAESVVIPAGTPVRVRTISELDSSTAAAGERLRFEVVEGVEVNGQTVIVAGLGG